MRQGAWFESNKHRERLASSLTKVRFKSAVRTNVIEMRFNYHTNKQSIERASNPRASVQFQYVLGRGTVFAWCLCPPASQGLPVSDSNCRLRHVSQQLRIQVSNNGQKEERFFLSFSTLTGTRSLVMTGVLVASKDNSSLLRPVIIRGGEEGNIDGSGNRVFSESDWTQSYGEWRESLQGTWLYDRSQKSLERGRGILSCENPSIP